MSSIISIISLGLLIMSGSVAAIGPAAVNLRTAANYAILSKTGVSTVPPSIITGNIGASPVASTFLTGFSLILDSSGTFATSSQVTGHLTAASYISPTPATLTTAISDMATAYTDASSRPSPNFINLNNGAIGGLILAPGLYKFASAVSIGSAVTIAGAATDTWIFQITGTLSIASAVKITLTGGALAKNIVWAVAGSVTFSPGSHFEGVLLAQTSATLNTGATANARILSQTFVTLQTATVAAPSS